MIILLYIINENLNLYLPIKIRLDNKNTSVNTLMKLEYTK